MQPIHLVSASVAGAVTLLVGFGLPACKTRVDSSLASRDTPSTVFGGKTQNQWAAAKKAEFDKYVGDHPISYAWFTDSAMGINGVPLVVLRALMDYQSDIFTDKNFALGFPPHLTDYANPSDAQNPGDLLPRDQRLGLPGGFAWERDNTDDNGRTLDPANAEDAKALRFRTLNVFFACNGCHNTRVIGPDGKVHYYPGGTSVEVEPQMYAHLLWLVGQRFMIDRSAGASEENVNVGRVNDFGTYLQKIRGRIDAGTLSPAYFFGNRYKVGPHKGTEAEQRQLALAELDRVLREWFTDDDIPAGTPKPVAAKMKKTHYPVLFGIVKNLLGSYTKVHITNKLMGGLTNYLPNKRDDVPMYADGSMTTPMNRGLHGPKPGQMDPWGLVQGNIALNAMREDASFLAYLDKRYAKDPANHDLYFGGNANPPGKARYEQAMKVVVNNGFGLPAKKKPTPAEVQEDVKYIFGKWYAQTAANIDIKSLWNSDEEELANWDGNQGRGARVLASGVSSVGDPRKVNTRIHASMNDFIGHLPSPAYPFDIKTEMAERGEATFKTRCATCHSANNATLYNEDPKVDQNRLHPISLMGRLGLVAMTMEACDIGRDVRKEYAAAPGAKVRFDGFDIDPNWCGPAKPDESDILAYVDGRGGTRDGGKPLGYKADKLDGVWALAPYLHNGSVPTMWALLTPSERPARFVRGDIRYDKDDMGFQWRVEPTPGDYPDGESQHFTWYDTADEGNKNTGHEYGSDLPPDQKRDLIEYLKTL
jgi:hypothetical protein